MNIAGLIKTSFVDYPGKMAAVIFTQQCNLNCSYCYNRSLLSASGSKELIPEEEVVNYILQRKKLLDGIVISGGEPSLQHDLIEFISRIKSFNISVKLDTNGTNPRILEQLINSHLVDYIAMDIKAPPELYSSICRTDVSLIDIEHSIHIISHSNISHEFRTTLIPELTLQHIESILAKQPASSPFYLQQYRDPISLSAAPPLEKDGLMITLVNQYPNAHLRGFSIG